MKKMLIILFVCGSINLFAQQNNNIEAVREVLQQQQEAWNKGDIESFMLGYWQSDSLVFIGKSGITKGWQTTLNNYKKSYPDKTTMGKLQFDLKSIEQFSPGVIYVIGKWELQRDPAKGNIGGHFTLVFKNINGRWVIVSDHTS